MLVRVKGCKISSEFIYLLDHYPWLQFYRILTVAVDASCLLSQGGGDIFRTGTS